MSEFSCLSKPLTITWWRPPVTTQRRRSKSA